MDEKVPLYKPFFYEGEADEMARAYVIGIEAAAIACEEHTYSSEEACDLASDELILWEDVRKGKRTTGEFIASLSDEQLAYLCIGAYQNAGEGGGAGVIGNSGMLVAGAAGETTHWLDDIGMKGLIMADGPAGLRLSTCYTLGEDGMARSATAPFSTGFEEYIEIPGMELLKRLCKSR